MSKPTTSLVANISQVVRMLEMQFNMNKIAIASDWWDAKSHPEVDFTTAIAVESGELAEHIGFKWWKAQTSNIDAAKLELVDIYHFLMSQVVTVLYESFPQGEMKDAEHTKVMFNEAISAILSGFNTAANCGAQKDIIAFKDNVKAADRKRSLSLTLRKMVSILDGIKTERFESVDEVTKELSNSVALFGASMNLFDMSFEELFLLYVGKNTLNRFRQDNDYKGGTYIKIWSVEDGEQLEDNDHMQRYLKTLAKLDNLDDGTDYEAVIYKFLKHEYSKVLKKTTLEDSKAS